MYVLSPQKLNTIYRKKSHKLEISLVTCLGTNKKLHWRIYGDKYSIIAQNMYEKTSNLSTHQVCLTMPIFLSFLV